MATEGWRSSRDNLGRGRRNSCERLPARGYGSCRALSGKLDHLPFCPYNHPDMATSASHRFEFRIQPESKQRIEHAANLVQESTSDFVRAAAERRADEVLREHDVVTVVPAGFFDDLLSALDEEPRASPALTRAAQRAREATVR
jgi:uncharacterized protein (DUF1778 family)